MKTSLLASAVIATIAWLGAAPAAEARHPHHSHPTHVFVSGYHSCGTPIYTERYVVRYDRWGRPMWGHRVIRHHHVPPHFRVPHRRPVVVAPCPPPHRHAPPRGHVHGHYSSGGVVIHGSYRR